MCRPPGRGRAGWADTRVRRYDLCFTGAARSRASEQQLEAQLVDGRGSCRRHHAEIGRGEIAECARRRLRDAAVLNQRFTLRAPAAGSPTRSARLVPNVSLRPPRSAAIIVSGKPRCQV